MEILFKIHRESGESLTNQIRQKLVSAILDGSLSTGAQLPSTRMLSRSLKVSRNTVVQVYESMVADGFLTAHNRSGYYINFDNKSGWINNQKRPSVKKNDQSPWTNKLKFYPSHQTYIEKPLDWQIYPYPFIYGQIDTSLFPLSTWRECTRLALAKNAMDECTCDAIYEDDPSLVEQICTKLLPRRGVFASPDEVLITLGAQNALYLAAALTTSGKSTVGMENPGYSDVRNAFLRQQALIKPIPVDRNGLIVDDALDDCDIVYTTPSHQYPTTATLSLERREELLARSVQSDFLILEDDYENETNFVDETIPALKSLDRNNRVLYVSSLSKSLFPGLRIGYMVGPVDFIKEARSLRRQMYRHPPANNQRTTSLFISLGHYDSLVKRLHEEYKERWQIMKDALSEHLPESTTAPTFGGTSYWVKAPGHVNATSLAVTAMQRGVVIEPCEALFYGARAPKNYFRLGYSSIKTERIEEGIKLLAVTLREFV